MSNPDNVRLDKWLWAVRIYKTRNQAAEACKKGRITIEGIEAKPSRTIKLNDIIFVKKLPVIYSYRVTGLIDKRVSAPVAHQNYDELTPEEELQKLKITETVFVKRDRGTGRPTKKERRVIDRLRNQDL